MSENFMNNYCVGCGYFCREENGEYGLCRKFNWSAGYYDRACPDFKGTWVEYRCAGCRAFINEQAGPEISEQQMKLNGWVWIVPCEAILCRSCANKVANTVVDRNSTYPEKEE